MVSNMSGSYGINIGGLLGQGPIFRFTPNAGPRRQGAIRTGTGRPTLYFPGDYTYIDHFVTFAVKKFTGVTRTSSLQSDSTLFGTGTNRRTNAQELQAHITLPMPSSLVANYNLDYANPTLSPLGELIAHAASIADVPSAAGAIGSGIAGISNAITNATQQTPGEIFSRTMTATQQAIVNVFQTIQGTTSSGAARAAGAAAVGIGATAAARTGGAGQAIIASLTGVVANPHKVILFQGVQHREHSFIFTLSPRNYDEAKVLFEIIYQIKYAMHPKYGVGETTGTAANALISPLPGIPQGTGQTLENSIGTFGAASRAFFEYPNVFDIEFSQADKTGSDGFVTPTAGNALVGKTTRLFTIGECVLQSFSVDYQPLNFPAYVASIKDPNAPLMPNQVVLTLRFQETDIVTKDQISKYNR